MVQLLVVGMKVRSKDQEVMGHVVGSTDCCLQFRTAAGVRFVRRRDIFTVESDGATLCSGAEVTGPQACCARRPSESLV